MAVTRLTRNTAGVVSNAAALTETVTGGTVTGRTVIFTNDTKVAVNVRGLATSGGATITAVTLGGKGDLALLDLDNTPLEFTLQAGEFAHISYDHTGATAGSVTIPAGGVTVRHNTSVALDADAGFTQIVGLAVAS